MTVFPFLEAHLQFLTHKNPSLAPGNETNINVKMVHTSKSLSSRSITTTSSEDEQSTENQHQEQQEWQREWEQRPHDRHSHNTSWWQAGTAHAFMLQQWAEQPAGGHSSTSDFFARSMSSSTMPALRLMATHHDDHGDDDLPDCDETPGARQKFVLAVIESALKILDTYGDEDDHENMKMNQESNILLPQ